MVQTLIGPEAFRKAMDLYFERHDGEAATVEDFVTCMEDASGRSLEQFMLWYTQAGTPELAVAGKYRRSERVYELTVTQMTPPSGGQRKKQPLHIPLEIGLIDADGKALPLTLDGHGALERPVLEITEEEQTFHFADVPDKPVPSLNRGFSCPVKLTSNLSDDDLLFLMSRDRDPFNRWEACQTYAGKKLLQCVEDATKDQPLRTDERLAEALDACLTDTTLEPAFVALMLNLPSENDLAARIGTNVDPWAIHTARSHLMAYLAGALHDRLIGLYDRLTDNEPYSPAAADAGRRALRNTVLDLLSRIDGPDLASRQFETASNMTDEMGALNVLGTIDAPERTDALNAFYDANKADHLLVDKWLALNAMAPFPDKIAEIRALTDHAAFSLKTPNKVRALVGTFSVANPVCFNHEDGSGYRFLADTVLALDSLNPQVAARLSSAFKNWRMMEPGRSALAKAEIERIKSRKGLSRDTLEIVTKTLQ